jgi:hypothetical protein
MNSAPSMDDLPVLTDVILAASPAAPPPPSLDDLPVLTDIVAVETAPLRIPEQDQQPPVTATQDTQAPPSSAAATPPADFIDLDAPWPPSVSTSAHPEPASGMALSPPPLPSVSLASSTAASDPVLRQLLLEALRQRFTAEIPTLVEATLQSAHTSIMDELRGSENWQTIEMALARVIPEIATEIRTGLEDSAQLALEDFLAQLQKR